MFGVKVTLSGVNTQYDERTDICVESAFSRCEFEYQFGKFLYAIETMGFNFETSEVYDSFMEEFQSGGTKFNKNYKLVYTFKDKDIEMLIYLKEMEV